MKKNLLLIFVTALICIAGTSYAVTKILAGEISFDSKGSLLKSETVQGAIDEVSKLNNKNIGEVAVPVIKGNLVPVVIENNGTVKKADTSKKWYDYGNKLWANAVILIDKTKTYNNGDTIPESNIQSYFVWIPRYRYKLWNVGTTNSTKLAHSIEIVFETKKTNPSTGSKNGEWLTHPAFTSFNVDGFWVGKFDTGYNGATSTAGAQVNANDSSKLIIKPNVYSWRNITVGNIFTTSYNYERDLDSHMMKNTEWGAVAYLSHSIYGIGNEVNINNNSSYKTGYSALLSTDQHTYPGTYGDGSSYNQPYNTEIGYLASTTGNITGIYDMSGGTHEYAAGYISGNVGSSGLTVSNYDSKYFDAYPSNSTATSYTNRILGDATGEMGPFKNYADGDGNSRYHSNWYDIHAFFADSSNPWFLRGGDFGNGVLAGQFNFDRSTGAASGYFGFRLVLTP